MLERSNPLISKHYQLSKAIRISISIFRLMILLVLVPVWLLIMTPKPYGNILAGVALFKAMTVTLSVAFGEWFQALYGSRQPDYSMIAIFSVLTIVSLVLLILYLIKLKRLQNIN